MALHIIPTEIPPEGIYLENVVDEIEKIYWSKRWNERAE